MEDQALGPLNDATAKHTIPLVEDRRLSRAQRSLGLVKLNLQCSVR